MPSPEQKGTVENDLPNTSFDWLITNLPLVSETGVMMFKQVCTRCQEDQAQLFDFDPPQVNDAVPRIFEIWTRAKNIRNSFAPINKLPPEILALVVRFLKPGLQLIQATTVCQHWRTVLLSFPHLWSRVRSSHPTLFEIYLERSKSAPLQVQLHDLRNHDHLFNSLVPHTPRLASLAVRMRDSPDFHLIARYLPAPIPTLREFSITVGFREGALEVPSGIRSDYFSHVKKLHLNEIQSFRAPHAFPNVTELVWTVGSSGGIPIAGLLDTIEQLPELELVEITFTAPLYHYKTEPPPHVVTLPHLQRMTLRRWNDGIPNILEFLKLPNLTSLDMDMVRRWAGFFPILPVTSFDEKLPNLSGLTEIEIHAHDKPRRIIFRSPQAVLECRAIGQVLGEQAYRHDRQLLGDIPLRFVRKLVIGLDKWTYIAEAAWVICLMRELESLEDLEIRGHCGCLLRYLRRLMMRGSPLPRIKTLTVHSGGTGRRQAFRLKDVMDGLGLGTIVTCITDPGVLDEDDLDEDGLSEDWDWIED